MNVRDYLITQRKFSLSELAARMWPNNKNAHNYLSAKLNNLDGRKFTVEDEKQAIKRLKELNADIRDDIKQLTITTISKSKDITP